MKVYAQAIAKENDCGQQGDAFFRQAGRRLQGGPDFFNAQWRLPRALAHGIGEQRDPGVASQ